MAQGKGPEPSGKALDIINEVLFKTDSANF